LLYESVLGTENTDKVQGTAPKVRGGQTQLVINRVSYGVNKTTCFGLLGGHHTIPDLGNRPHPLIPLHTSYLSPADIAEHTRMLLPENSPLHQDSAPTDIGTVTPTECHCASTPTHTHTMAYQAARVLRLSHLQGPHYIQRVCVVFYKP